MTKVALSWVTIIVVLTLLTIVLVGCTTTTGQLAYYPPPGLGANIPADVTEVQASGLTEICGLSPGRLVGCGRLNNSRCEIYIAAGMAVALRSDVIAHERAHCAGWTHG